MSKADVTRFVADVKINSQLQNDLINKLSISDIVAVANKNGYQLTEEDVREYSEEQKAQLTQKELEAVSAGGGFASAAVANMATANLTVAPSPPPQPPPNFIQGLIVIF